MHMLTERNRTMIQARKTAAAIILRYAIENGEGKRAKGYKDNKCLISVANLRCLLNAGAKILELNTQASAENVFTHQVCYKEHIFITVTSSRVDW